MRVISKKESRPFRGDTLALFEKLGGGDRDTILLESMDGSGRNNVKSLLFVGSALRLEARGNIVSVHVLSQNGAKALCQAEKKLGRFGEVVRKEGVLDVQFPETSGKGPDLERIKAPSSADVLRFFNHALKENNGGDRLFLPGVFSYDFIDSFEQLPPAKQDMLSFPDYVFWLPEKMVVVDHTNDTATAVVSIYGETDLLDSDDVPFQLEDVFLQLKEGIDSTCEPQQVSVDTGVATDYDSFDSVDLDDPQFESLVDTMKSHIVAGDVFQIVPSRTFSLPCTAPLEAYGELRKLNPSPYMFVVNGPDFCLFGASPESCVSVSQKPHRLTLRPIAGTRPRGFLPNGETDWDLDNRLEAELKLDEKELAEHMMLVDLARNDVARISKPGSRRVFRLLEAERYSHVMHLVSAVEGALKEGLDALHAYVGSMNMGTLVGAPKIEAARLLRKYEGSKRGTYGGAVGYLASDGALDTAIIIRSAYVKEDVAYVRAGAGVVFDSSPQAEARETRNKAKAVLLAIQRAKE